MRSSNKYLHSDIKRSRRKVAAAKSELRRTLRRVQDSCNHEKVVEAPYHRSEYLWNQPAIRACIHCGLTEYSRYGSDFGGKWGHLTPNGNSMDTDYGLVSKLDTEFVKFVSRDEIGKYTT